MIPSNLAPHSRLALGLSTLVVLACLPLEAKRKDDVVIMKNGDRFTGEVKKLEKGILYFKADYMTTSVELDWFRVARLESQDQYTLSFANGQRGTGSLERNEEATIFSTGADRFPARYKPEQIVSVVPAEQSFLAQMTGSIDYGFSFTSGNNATQSSLSSSINYVAAKWRLQANGSSVFNSQTGSERSGRNNVDYLYVRSVSQHWFIGGNGSFLNSQQQDLTLRTTLGGGIGRDFIQSGTAGLFVLAGVVMNRERYSTDDPDQPTKQGVEGQLQVNFNKYTFTKTQISGKLTAYPNVTTPGRVRLGGDFSLRFQLARNLYLKLSLYENFDNRPPVNAKKNDFGTNTSIGWTF